MSPFIGENTIKVVKAIYQLSTANLLSRVLVLKFIVRIIEKNTILEFLVSLLTDKILHASFGTWRTDLRSMFLDNFTKPFPAIGEKLPSVILIFSLLEHGE